MAGRVTGDPSAAEAAGDVREGIDPSRPVSEASLAVEGRGHPGDVAGAATRPRAVAAGSRPACEIWGILNVTPDSFSDGGRYLARDAALAHGVAMARDGAAVLDVGGESSRPAGSTYGDVTTVSEAEELRRVLPVIEALRACGARISIDTVKPGVAEGALAAGAQIVNDVSCGRSEGLLRVAAEAKAELVLMHNRGRGERSGANVRYRDVAREVRDELLGAVERALCAGVARDRIWIDPGLGFAKTAEQSLALLGQCGLFAATGFRVLVGPSRKSFIGELTPLASGERPDAQQRLGGTLAAVTAAVLGGAHAVRVHDVLEARQAGLLALRLRGAHS